MKQLTLIKIAGIVCSLAAFGMVSSASAAEGDVTFSATEGYQIEVEGGVLRSIYSS